jgi:Cu2+-exporting ATPase
MKREFKVEGMSCGHCRSHVERALGSVAGVTSATVTLTPPEAVVEFSGPVETMVAGLKKAVADAGYRLVE